MASTKPSNAPLDLSVVLPVYNEEENLDRVLDEIGGVLEGLGRSFEIIVVDDGSSDGSCALLERRVAEQAGLKVIVFARNYGQAAAMDAGLAHSVGALVVTLDADGQNDPADIGALLLELERGADVVTGWRRDRKDHLLRRRLPSRVANRLICTVLRLPIHDLGCTLRLYRRPVVDRLHLQPGLHRFIVPMASAAGAKISEVEVHHRERVAGETKYGLSRVFPVLRDFLRVYRMTRRPELLPVRPTPTAYRIARTVGFGEG